MLRIRRFAALWGSVLGTLAALGCGPSADAQPAAAPTKPAAVRGQGEASELAPGEKWVRLLRNKRREALSMQTAIVRFVPADDFDASKKPESYNSYVDLVGAVHIADRAYYQKLNRRFENYDAVLYELVASEGTVVPRGRGTSNSHPLGALQNGMKSMLEVEHQLEQIDYTRRNFVHADMSPDEFLESMENRQEGFVQMYFKILGAQLAQQSKQAAEGENSDIDFMAALFAEDRARRLKVAMAKQFEGMEELMVGLSGPEGSTIITERNKRALDVLEKQLAAGKKRLAIFYGAGHLPDMQTQMEKRFGMRPVSAEWLDAWDLREK